MKNALFGLAGLLIAAGVVAGPGYYLYNRHLSGSKIDSYPISGQAAEWPVDGGVTLKFRGGRASKPVSVDLDPSMNPVGMNWSGSTSGGGGLHAKFNEYRAHLYRGGESVLVEYLTVSRAKDDSGGTKRVPLGTFEVQVAGRYHFVLEEARPPELYVSSMWIEMRRNVTVPNMQIVFSGAALLAAGLLIGFGTVIMTAEPMERPDRPAWDPHKAPSRRPREH